MKLSLRSLLFDLIFDERCPICNGKSFYLISPLCENCWNRIKPFSNHKVTKGQFHDDFWRYIKALYSYSNYEGTLKEAIHLFKYNKIKRIGIQLGKLLCKIEKPQIDVIIPVPLHVKKLRQREFNQSAILARELSKSWRVKLVLDCLVKTRNTQEQALLNGKERRENLRNVFMAMYSLDKMKVALIDDVVTSGSTLTECAKVLKRAGAQEIYAITLAKTN